MARSTRKLVFEWTLSVALLYAAVLLLAIVLKGLAARSGRWTDLGATFLDYNGRPFGETIAVVVVIVLAVSAPRLGRRPFLQCERIFERFAMQRTQALFAAAIFPVVVRLALLPAVPIPQPYMPDEFGHLLLADTFASGRIANPTHPMWHYFESLYVFHQPVYTAQYPIAQGLLMALPLALHLPAWLGVFASIGLMCSALAWMLQAWLPPKWALLGALIAAGRFSIPTYWLNSYWGGAAPAIGGALLVGAVPRLFRKPRTRDACLAALGVAVLSQSRPFEGALLSLPAAALLLYRFAGRAHRNLPVLAALAGAAVLTAGGTLYYNSRVTGDPWLWPYQWHQKIYGVPQNLLGSRPILSAPRRAVQPDILNNFQWQLGLFEEQSSWRGLAAALPEKIDTLWSFYFQPILSLPLLFLPFALAPRPVRFLLWAGTLILTAELVLYPFFFPHYAAPLCGLFLIATLEGARRMRAARWRGASLFRWWMIAGAFSGVVLVIGAALAPDLVVQADPPRARIERELEQRGGKHLVLVRYTTDHNYHHPWIYNAADIDKSPVVWARAADPSNLAPLLRYYRDRKVWLVTVGADDDPPLLTRYEQRRPNEKGPPEGGP
jgi:hypothetical protein